MRKEFNPFTLWRWVPALTVCVLLLVGSTGAAQTSATPLPDAPAAHSADSQAVTARSLPKQFVKDQEAIWTSPAHIRINDLDWLVPMAALTAGTLETDRDAMIHVVTNDTKLNHDSVNASNALLGAIVAVPVVNLGYGLMENHEHARETGLLTAEAAADSAVVEEAMKLVFWRERPTVDNANGKFWQSSVGADSSFPSSHAIFAWSTAAILAGEYPSAWSRFAVYTLATGVSATRVMGQEHFPSDVLVGSAAGWLIGHYVYKVRHHWQPREG